MGKIFQWNAQIVKWNGNIVQKILLFFDNQSLLHNTRSLLNDNQFSKHTHHTHPAGVKCLSLRMLVQRGYSPKDSPCDSPAHSPTFSHTNEKPWHCQKRVKDKIMLLYQEKLFPREDAKTEKSATKSTSIKKLYTCFFDNCSRWLKWWHGWVTGWVSGWVSHPC